MSKQTLVEQINSLPKTDCLFVKIENYENAKGGVADYIFNAGMSYEQAKEKDIEFVKKWMPSKKEVKSLQEKLNEKSPKDPEDARSLLKEAKVVILASLKKETKTSQNQSEGQKNAYESVGPVTRRHIESGDVQIYGLLHEKVVIKPEPEKKPVNSRPLTLAKNVINKQLKTNQFRPFKLDKMTTAKVSESGKTMVIR